MSPEHTDAARLARAAGHLLLRIRSGSDRFVDRAELGREADRRSNELLSHRLATLYPGDAILSEESAEDGRRFDCGRVWIVDPLDGTREFTEPGRNDWAVHVALVAGGLPVAAAVALPAQRLVMSTAARPAVPARSNGHLRMVVSRSRPPAIAAAVADAIDAELVPMGSAGAKAMAVVRGEVDVYLHDGGQYEWDSAAPAGVAAAAGLHCSRLDGTPLMYNNPSPWSPEILICRPELADTILRIVEQVRADDDDDQLELQKGTLQT
ncbi:MAG: 3'(2'),5'-bisphosphate nucleotidase CysQ [Acidimicrobiales bacterium]